MYRQTMDNKPYIYIEKRKANKNKKTKPSKVVMGFSLIIALLLPFFLVKNFSHAPYRNTTTQSIELPNLDEDESEDYPNEISQEDFYKNQEEQIADGTQSELIQDTSKTVVEK